MCNLELVYKTCDGYSLDYIKAWQLPQMNHFFFLSNVRLIFDSNVCNECVSGHNPSLVKNSIVWIAEMQNNLF